MNIRCGDVPWWRDDPLSDREHELLTAMRLAHVKSTYRENASSQMVLTAWLGSGDFTKAIAAGLLTLGDRHGPIEKAVASIVQATIADGIVPGWGSSFHKGADDPDWAPVRVLLEANWPKLAGRLALITAALEARGAHVRPNPAAYTAAVAIALGIPPKLAPWLFVSCRLDAWASICLKGRVRAG